MPDIILEIDKIKNPNSGLGQFTSLLSKSILKAKGNLDIGLYGPKDMQFSTQIFKSCDLHRYLPLLLPKSAVWHALHQECPYIPNTGNLVLTIQDMNYIYKKPSGFLNAKFKYILQKKIDRASRLTFISKFAMTETQRFFEFDESIASIIYNGIERPDIFEKPTMPAPSKFLYTISTLLPKKNIHVLVDMMKELPEDIHLILSGPRSAYSYEVEKDSKNKSLEHRIHFTGPVNNAQKFWYQKHCSGFIFPSLFEGFGLGPAEAMQFGVPLFLSRLTSLPEVGGDDAFYFDNFKGRDMAEVVSSGLDSFSEDQKNRLMERSRCYDWDKAANDYISIYKELL